MTASHPAPTPELSRISALRPEPLLWLWLYRLALGKLALLEGDPGLGKSLIALDLCARVTRGRPMPDGAAIEGPANVIVLNAEDGAADTVRSRLAALDADLDRVFVLTDLGLGLESVRLPSQIAALDAALTETKAKLVVIDPLLPFLDSNIASGNDQSIRRALTPLAILAARHGCVILLIRHLNTRSGKHAVYRGGGAIGLLGACRSAWLVGRDPGVAGQCVLAQVKNNLAPPQPSLAYRVEASGDTVTLSWRGTSQWSADQVLTGQPRGTARVRARAFLLSALQGGPRLVREIWAEGQKQDLLARTLRRARQDLEISTQTVMNDGRRNNWWLLPGQRLPASAYPPVDPACDLEPWLAPLREKYGTSTPLDDIED